MNTIISDTIYNYFLSESRFDFNAANENISSLATGLFGMKFGNNHIRILDTLINGYPEDLKKIIHSNVPANYDYNIENSEKILNNKADNIHIPASIIKVEKNDTMPDIHEFDLTDLQKDVVEHGINAIKNEKRHLLLSCVMRFGKSICGLAIAQESGAKSILVTSAKADTRSAWRDEIYNKRFLIDDNFEFIEFDNIEHPGMVLVSNRTQYMQPVKFEESFIYNEITDGKKVVLYATLQDLSGIKSGDDHLMKKRHEQVFMTDWDIIICDECHYASRSSVDGVALGYGGDTDTALDTYTDQQLSDSDNEFILVAAEAFDYELESMIMLQHELDEFMVTQLKFKTQLHLSGTPYSIMDSGEYDADDAEIIGDYSYGDMVNARNKWSNDNPDKNEWESPYAGIPDLIKIGLKLPECCSQFSSFGTLFEIKSGIFIHQKTIEKFINILFNNNGLLTNEYVSGKMIFDHICWTMPTVASCHLMGDLLKTVLDKNQWRIIVAVENIDTADMDADARDTAAINAELDECELHGIKTITLTVNRLLTAVSVPMWQTMLYMKDTRNAQEYDQNVFRVCTRRMLKCDDFQLNMKRTAYVIDFDIDRMLDMASENNEGIQIYYEKSGKLVKKQ